MCVYSVAFLSKWAQASKVSNKYSIASLVLPGALCNRPLSDIVTVPIYKWFDESHLQAVPGLQVSEFL